MIKAVVFDLDDTLILEKDYIKSGFNIVSKKISLDYNLNKDDIFNKLQDIFIENSKNVFNKLLDILKLNYDEKYIQSLIYEYRNHEPNIELLKDSKEIIKYLKDNGYKIGIITDGYKETQNKKVKVLKLNEIIDQIIISDDLGREFWKPNEISYKKISEKLGCNFTEIVYVGDNEGKDFISAKKLGIKTFKIFREDGVYRDNLYREEFKADIEINNLMELKEFLNM